MSDEILPPHHRPARHRSSPAATEFFGARVAPVEEAPRRRRFSGTLGQLTVSARSRKVVTTRW